MMVTPNFPRRGEARQGGAGRGESGRGEARQLREPRAGTVAQISHGGARLGMARHGWARLGMARHGWARLGMARHGKARQLRDTRAVTA